MVREIKFNSNMRVMEKGNRVIICNRVNGKWLKISLECYDILLESQKEKHSKEQLLNSFEHEEDRVYFEDLVLKLEEIGVLYKEEQREIADISLTVTHRCNLKCKHCIVDATSLSPTDKYDLVSLKNIVNKIVKLNPLNITITGGEPLVRRDIYELLSYIKEIYSGKITFMTNGVLLTAVNVKKIIDKVDNIDISIDGVDEETCSSVRGKGVFSKVLNAIDLLHKNDFKNISLSMVLTAKNAQVVDEFYELNRKLDTKPILRALSVTGRALENKDELLEPSGYGRKTESYSSEGKDLIHGTCTCTAGYDQLVIDYDGSVYPCNLFVEEEYCLGNVDDVEDLAEFLKVKEGEFICDKLLKFEPCYYEKCKNCNVNYFCWSCLHEMLDCPDIEERCREHGVLYSNIFTD